jgi:phosphopantothenoylcysteine synthetase/decarboxylase
MNLVICVTGAISCVNTPAYLLALRQARPDDTVTVIMSESATHMILPPVVSLFADKVIEPAQQANWSEFNHVEMASTADLVVVSPASAACLSRLARGDGDDLIGLVALAHPQPLLIFPSMNRSMWRNAAVMRNCETLISDGHTVVRHETTCVEVLTGDPELSPAIPPPKEWVAIIAKHGDLQEERGVGLVDAS